MKRFLPISSIVLILAATAFGDDKAPKADPPPAGHVYRVEVERIVSEESMLVTRYVITAPRTAQLTLTRFGSRSGTQLSPDRNSPDGPATAKLTIVAAVGSGGSNWETHHFKIQTWNGSAGGTGSGSSSSRWYGKVGDLISLTAKAGEYKLGEPLELGVFEKTPIVLLVK